MMHVYSDYFYGNKISNYGIQNGFVDYATLAKSFDCVLNNTIPNIPEFWDYTEQLSGMIDNSENIAEMEEQINNAYNAMKESEDPKVIAEIERDIEGMQRAIEELEEEENEQPDIYQWYIVSESGADILQECNEIVFYNSEMDLYLWGVTHYGTSWDYVLTNIKCNTGEF